MADGAGEGGASSLDGRGLSAGSSSRVSTSAFWRAPFKNPNLLPLPLIASSPHRRPRNLANRARPEGLSHCKLERPGGRLSGTPRYVGCLRRRAEASPLRASRELLRRRGLASEGPS